jgi:hypothetical protein
MAIVKKLGLQPHYGGHHNPTLVLISKMLQGDALR